MTDDAPESVDTNHGFDVAPARFDEAVALGMPSPGSTDEADPNEADLAEADLAESDPDLSAPNEPEWFDAELAALVAPASVPVELPVAPEQDDRRSIPAPSGWSDPATGNDGPAYWDRILASEHARVRRYKHPATLVIVEVEGIEQVAATWGRDAAMRILTGIGRALANEARSSDSSARIEPSRFGILLTETDEIAAINFVERARVACEARLELTDSLRIGIGWASLGKDELGETLDLAAERLDADLAAPS